MNVITADATRFDEVYGLLEQARAWHLANHPWAWPVFARDGVLNDINEGRVFLFQEGQETVATLTVTHTDPLVWDDAQGSALYLHRLMSRRDLGGRGIGGRVLEWARGYAAEQGKEFLRLDTWGINDRLRQYYESMGFTLARTKLFPEDTPLPDHYRGASMNLFEMRLVPPHGPGHPAAAPLLAAS